MTDNEKGAWGFGTLLGLLIGMFLHYISPKEIKSPKPITPELQITGNGVDMDTVYIYKLKE